MDFGHPDMQVWILSQTKSLFKRPACSLSFFFVRVVPTLALFYTWNNVSSVCGHVITVVKFLSDSDEFLMLVGRVRPTVFLNILEK